MTDNEADCHDARGDGQFAVRLADGAELPGMYWMPLPTSW